MIEAGSAARVARTWPGVSRGDRGAFAWLRTRLRGAGKGLAAVSLWMAGFCPLYVFFETTLRGFRQQLDRVSSLALIGMGVSFIYVPFYLANSPETPLLDDHGSAHWLWTLGRSGRSVDVHLGERRYEKRAVP